MARVTINRKISEGFYLKIAMITMVFSELEELRKI
jgi:hypothetical protein